MAENKIRIQIDWDGKRSVSFLHGLLDLPGIVHASSYYEEYSRKEVLVVTVRSKTSQMYEVIHLLPGDTLTLNWSFEEETCEAQLRRDSEGPPSEPVSMQESGRGMGLILT